MKDTKKKRFKLFDTQREGKGVSKADVYTKTDLKGFFIKYKECFGRLFSINILMVLGNFPLIFVLLAMSTFTRILYLTPATESFPVLHGLFLEQTEISASNLVTAGIEGLQIEANAMTTWTYVFFALGGLVLFTFGMVNAGTTYLLRNMVQGEPAFTSDFFYAVKRNWKQALPYGILDAILLFLIPFNLVTLFGSGTDVFSGIMGGINLAFAIIYFFMRFYIYLQMVTFDLSIGKILKNSLIMTMLGMKRNLVAGLGILCLVILDLLLLFAFNGIFAAAAILMPLVLLFSSGAFMAMYAAYFVVKRIMIDPYYSEPARPDAADEDTEEDDEDVAADTPLTEIASSVPLPSADDVAEAACDD